jgi:hypothetical protein
MSTDFLQRWSRRKHAAAASAVSTAASPKPPPTLPALEDMTFESDFKAFMHAKVDEGVRRAALRKLFSDPRFNVMDGLDIYIGDYSIEDPISPGVLAQLEHARTTLLGPVTEKQEIAREDLPAESEHLSSSPSVEA